MPATYNIKEAQANLTKLCRSGRKFVISNRNRPVVVALPVEDFEALLETLDVLEDPAAMKAVHAVKVGTTKYRALNLSDDNFGL
ncbi:MAG: type II toxin-antitoxin system Phd/YefM family antitoxin [Spartobacteria bacterium]